MEDIKSVEGKHFVIQPFPFFFNTFPTPRGSAQEHLLGPLHTRAKSRDHKIVRAQKKVSSQDTSKIM
jgi:hypothetical protein